ncbi:conserved hypothetical protein [Rubrivivax sp. A210]|uniref:hypothetical protein n=1 Tax=Rubrivivax sp. A210 TaxID=2772301 RepID=UPI00191A9F57|nr:hypothetical protein [Rubrivivax sp. A210]CAD5372994.1 conserved hypothetical protein [Rubrivivax sp. A210]
MATTTPRSSLFRRAALAAALVLPLVGCGGGLYIDIGDIWGPPPDVSLVASSDFAQRGEFIRLSAAASAVNGLDQVSFYRIDPGVDTRLATLSGPPFQIETAIPANAGRTVSYFASACDDAGFCTDSAVVTVNVVP